MYQAGVELANVQRFGRWLTPVVHQYLWETHDKQRTFASSMVKTNFEFTYPGSRTPLTQEPNHQVRFSDSVEEMNPDGSVSSQVVPNVKTAPRAGASPPLCYKCALWPVEILTTVGGVCVPCFRARQPLTRGGHSEDYIITSPLDSGRKNVYARNKILIYIL